MLGRFSLRAEENGVVLALHQVFGLFVVPVVRMVAANLEDLDLLDHGGVLLFPQLGASSLIFSSAAICSSM